MQRLSEVVRPLMVSVICDSELSAIERGLEESRRWGAAAVELNLAQVHPNEFSDLKQIVRAHGGPIYTSCRQAKFMAVYGFDPSHLMQLRDEERVERQLTFLDVAVAIDMEFNTFAIEQEHMPGLPRETGQLGTSAETACRQRAIIDEVHRRGREVVLSCHTGVALNTAETVLLARAMIDRGADIVKLAHAHHEASYCAELWKTSLALEGELQRPFVLLSIGPGSSLFRRLAGHFSSSFVFVRPRCASYFFPSHPTLEEVRQLWELLPPSFAVG
jgi:hypothetical protein